MFAPLVTSMVSDRSCLLRDAQNSCTLLAFDSLGQISTEPTTRIQCPWTEYQKKLRINTIRYTL